MGLNAGHRSGHLWRLHRVAVPGCTPTGYFRLITVGDRWVLADPSCNAFSYLGVQKTSLCFYADGNYSSLLQARYGNNFQQPWMVHTKQRLQAWGFSAVGDYAYEPLNADAQNPRMPGIILVKPSGGSIMAPTRYRSIAASTVINTPLPSRA